MRMAQQRKLFKQVFLNDLYEMNIRICEIEGKRFCLYH